MSRKPRSLEARGYVGTGRLALCLGLSVDAVELRIREGQIEAIRPGRNYYIPLDVARALVAEHWRLKRVGLTVEQAADRLCCCRKHVHYLLSEGVLTRIGNLEGKWRQAVICPVSVEEYRQRWLPPAGYLTRKEAAGRCGVYPETLVRWLTKHNHRVLKRGHFTFVRESHVERYLEAKRRSSAPAGEGRARGDSSNDAPRRHRSTETLQAPSVSAPGVSDAGGRLQDCAAALPFVSRLGCGQAMTSPPESVQVSVQILAPCN